MSRNKKSPEEFDDNFDIENTLKFLYNEKYGHDHISDMSDDFDPRHVSAYKHIVQEKDEYKKEFEKNVNDRLDDETRAAIDSLQEIPFDEIRESYVEFFNEFVHQNYDDGYYITTVDPKVKKGFEIAGKILTQIARKNRGYVNVDTDMNSIAFKSASIKVISHGIHIENNREFRAIMTKFFTTLSIWPTPEGNVGLEFVYNNYYKTTRYGNEQ